MGRRKHERPAPALPPCRHQLNRYCPPAIEPAGSSSTPSISPAARKVVDLAAEADIGDVMPCDLPGVPSFLGLPPEAEMPPGNKGKTKLKKLYRKVAPSKAHQRLDLAPRHGRDQGIGAHPARRDRQSGRKRLM